LVNIVDEWASLERYARQASADKLTGLYQLLEVDGKLEVRVWIGDCGFKKTFENINDQEIIDIRDFCWKEQYTQIRGNIPNDKFFDP